MLPSDTLHATPMRRTTLIPLLATLLLAACGSTGATPEPPSGFTLIEQPSEESAIAPAGPLPSGVSAPTEVVLAPKTVLVQMTDAGFLPETVTVRSGGSVVFMTTGSKSRRPITDPHPEHDGYKGFDSVRDVPQNSNFTYTFTKSGTWAFHDELDPAVKGTVIVQ